MQHANQGPSARPPQVSAAMAGSLGAEGWHRAEHVDLHKQLQPWALLQLLHEWASMLELLPTPPAAPERAEDCQVKAQGVVSPPSPLGLHPVRPTPATTLW